MGLEVRVPGGGSEKTIETGPKPVGAEALCIWV